MGEEQAYVFCRYLWQLDPSVNIVGDIFIEGKDLDELILLFYINEPSIIIGRNQNTIEEINADYVEANKIHIVRREAIEGAVYHDLGNFSSRFITKDDAILPRFRKSHKLYHFLLQYA